MKVLIVEDEALASERLEQMLIHCDDTIEVLDSIDTVKDAAVFMDSRRDELDLVFLDIQLADGKSFEIFNKINYPKPVIFTTAYDEYALKAFKLNSVDYLLKPIKKDELSTALNKFKTISANNREVQPTVDRDLLERILSQNPKKYKQRFLVKFGSRIQFKNTNEAAYFYAEDKICYLILKHTGKKYMIDHTLEELANELLDPQHFFRISRQYIVNIDTIQEVKSYQNNRLELLLNIPYSGKLVVSRSRTADFKEWLNN
ncbi:response regulator transcription factor [Fulvivirga sp. M361]|uniref:LytR/AlgR family response regulator transcription factor n=1 Tax=Fulvivirga sp. M361 TaxID=2594266 RepID=UPI001179CC89|nr:LytTR family DNA-binding domain-containing protein [Fulvivirga sp. M361]TRX62701.1 response regulator transcription factor [Fulvivirga sp. M361]